MKKSYFWGLLFAIMALIPVQNAFAEYCTTPNSGSTTHSRTDRGLTSFTFSDGVNSVAVTDVQTNAGSYWSPSYNIYVDKTSSVLETSPGATISLSQLAWGGIWMHGYIYVDYDKDEVFNQDNELVSYNFYSADASSSGVDSNGNAVSSNCNVTVANMPSFKIPSDLKEGQYRLRFKIDWNSKDPCGNPDSNNSLSQNGGCIADITLNVVKGLPERTISVNVIPEGAGVVTGAGTAGGNITLSVTPNSGYDFVNWTLDGVEVGTALSYTDATEGDKTYTANFAAKTAYPTMTYLYSNGLDQTNRYLKEVTATAGETVTTVFSATTVTELPQEDPETIGSTATNGAYVDKTANPIIVPVGTEEISVNFIAWTDAISANGTNATAQLNWTQQAVFIDWNNNYDFYEEGENYGKNSDNMPNADFIAATGYTRTFAVPAGVQPGTYRMRVCYNEPNGSNTSQWQNTLFDKGNCQTRNGKTYDFAIQVVTSETPIYNISVSVNDDTMGSASKSVEETVYTLTATANEGYEFVNWTLEGAEVSTEATYTFTAEADAEYVANFQAIAQWPATMTLIDEAKALIVKDGVGYPSATAKATFKEALDAAEGNPTIAALVPLQAAMDAYIDTDDIVLPTADKAYAFISRGKTANFYMYNNAGTLALASYTEGMELPATAMFVCQYDEEASKYVFKTSDGAYYLAYPSPGKGWLNDKSETGLETELRRVSQFSIETLTIDGTNVVATPEDLFGYVHLWGYRGNETKNGVTSDFNGPMIVTSAGAFDGAGGDFYNSTTSSAFSVIEVELPTPTFAVSAVSADATMGSATVSAAEVEEGAEATFTATANAGYKFTCWTVGTDTISTENPYTTTISAATELTANFEALVPSIVLTATPDVERQFSFEVAATSTIFIDWGDGVLAETETIVASDPDPSWIPYIPTVINGTPVGEGIVKIYGDITYFDCSYSTTYPSKVTSLDVTNAISLIALEACTNELTTLDLSNNSALLKLTAYSNPMLSTIVWPTTNNITSLTLNDCAFTSIDLSACTALTSVNLNNNTGLGSIDVSANTALTTLRADNTGLTTIDVSSNTVLKNLYVNNNQLTTVDVSNMVAGLYLYANNNQLTSIVTGESNVTSKSRIQVTNNNFTLATLPAFTPITKEGTSGYNYVPQAVMTIATEINEGEELDLSAQNNIVGRAAEAQATDYTWYLADGTEFTNYTEADGKFVFDVTEDTELYCTMTTAAFPSFSGANAFKTTNIVVKNVAVPVTISVATSNEYYGTAAIDGVTGTSTEVMAGDDVTVVATPAEAFADYIVYEFEAWTAGTDTISTENPYTFTAAEALSLTANFGCYMMVNVTASEGGSAYINDAVAEATVKLPYQSKATLHAVANEGYAFSHWTYTTATGTETVWNESTADQQFTVGQYTAFTAYFVPVATERKVQIQSNDITMGYVTIISPSLGGTGTGTGTDTGTGTGTGTGSATSGGGQKPWIITSEDVTAQAFTNGSTYEFVNWTINGEEVGTETTYTYTGSEEAVIQANFRVKVVTYNVNIATATGQETFGTVEIVGYEGTSANIEAGTEITIVATPAEGYQFMSWSDALGSDVSTEASYTFTVNSSVYLEAWFESAPVATTYKLMIGVAPTAECGTVEIVGYEGTSADIEENASVTITATANEGYELIGWSSDLGATFVSTESSYTFTMTSATILQAFFEEAEVVVPTTYAVTVQAAPTSDYGTVAIEGAEGTTAQIEENASVTVVATPAEGYALEGWYDITGATLLSTDLSYTFTVTAETTVVAWFMEATPEAPEYCIDFGTSTRSGGRYMESLTFSDGAHETTVNVNQQNGYGAPIYFDKTDVNVSLEASKTITSNVNWHGEWMHSYLFVDWNNDGEFTRNLGTNLVPEEDSELIAFSFWSGVDGNSQENEGYNSAGQYITGDNRSVWSLPEFTIPTSISEGTYRARLKIDWNTADPCSVMSTQDAPCVVDFMITVTYPDGIADADADAVQVYAANGVIYINGYEGDVKVVNAAGQVVKDVMVNGAEQLNVNAGLYMVVTGDKVTKVVVK